MNPTYRQFFEMIQRKFEGSTKMLCGFVVEDAIAWGSQDNPADWQDHEIDGDNAINVYGFFIGRLKSKAIELESIPDDPVWEQANEILATVRQTLEETHDDGDLYLDEVTIVPPYKEMAALGLLDVVEGADGEQYVVPTPLCEQVADEVQREIDAGKQGEDRRN